MTLNAITQVSGFKAAGITCGLKQSDKKDLTLIVSDCPATWAAVFTTNVFQAAPVLYDKALLTRTGGNALRAIIINAGIANACTGNQGRSDAEQMARYAENAANLPRDSVFVMSTGVIGNLLPMDKIEAGITDAVQSLSTTGGALAAEAIMTTDTVPKTAFMQIELDGQQISIGGIAKGSGMIHPDMATILSTIVTNATIAPADLDAALRTAVNQSFNRVSVDGDTSTNDTVVIMAAGTSDNGVLNGDYLTQFTKALTDVCITLAKMIARDGEGATKLVEIQIKGAASETEAKKAAATLATSPLSKTAIFGSDPNWGRFLAAVGRSGAQVVPSSTDLWLITPNTTVKLVEHGRPLSFDAVALSEALRAATEVTIIVDLGVGKEEATYWTCDFSYKYVEINAEYHT